MPLTIPETSACCVFAGSKTNLFYSYEIGMVIYIVIFVQLASEWVLHHLYSRCPLAHFIAWSSSEKQGT